MGKIDSTEYKTHMSVAKDLMPQDDLRFFHVDKDTYEKSDLQVLNILPGFFDEHTFSLRIFRRRNLGDYKIYEKDQFGELDSESMTQFIFRSSFIG